MRSVAAAAVLLGAGLVAGHALADTVPVPVPTVSVPVPTAPVPVPVSPKLPAPTMPAPTAGGSSSAPSARSSGSSSGSRPDRPQIESLRSSRTWISTSGPKRRRGTTLTFVLPRDAGVILVVKQVSPTCRVAGQFSVHGHAGLNRVRFLGRAKHLQ